MSTRMRTSVGLLGGVVVLGLLLTIPFGADGVVRPDRDGVLEITMTGYRFVPNELLLPTERPVTLVFVNQDEVTHHISFGREVIEQEGRDVAYAEDLFAGLAPTVSPPGAVSEPEPPYQGFTVVVKGGGTVTVEVTLPADRIGSWEVGCFTGRGCHYRAGLAASVVVE